MPISCRTLFLSTLLTTAITTTLLVSQTEKAQTFRTPQFDNASVKVWKTLILPHQPLALHRHDHPRVIIALTGGTMNIVESTGTTETHHWETGKAYWLPAMPPNTAHSDVNAGEKPIEVMVVELEKEQ